MAASVIIDGFNSGDAVNYYVRDFLVFGVQRNVSVSLVVPYLFLTLFVLVLFRFVVCDGPIDLTVRCQ
ncbi:MAG: hypothetical protein DI613_13310 [Kocuria rhizophila]|nr:MAG: hypothetical protein DI613_13310 [Kocuria rhizophila]